MFRSGTLLLCALLVQAVLVSCAAGGGNPLTTADSGLDSSAGVGGSGGVGAAGGSGFGATGGNTEIQTCGDGVITGSEQCDGSNFGGESCATLGEGSGTLVCDPVTCSLDVSMCTHDNGGSGGNGGNGGYGGI
jgi:hypothetical protein